MLRVASGDAYETRLGAGHSLRLKLAVLSGFIVAAAVGLTTMLGMWLSTKTHEGALDTELRSKTLGLARQLDGASEDQTVSYTHLTLPTTPYV